MIPLKNIKVLGCVPSSANSLEELMEDSLIGLRRGFEGSMERKKIFFLNSAEGCLLLEHFKHVLLTCGVNGEIGLSTTFNVAPSDNKTTY